MGYYIHTYKPAFFRFSEEAPRQPGKTGNTYFDIEYEEIKKCSTQRETIDRIEYHVEHAVDYVQTATIKGIHQDFHQSDPWSACLFMFCSDLPLLKFHDRYKMKILLLNPKLKDELMEPKRNSR